MNQVCVGDLAIKMRTGPFGSQLLHSEFVDSGVAVIGIDNVVKNHFAWGQPRFISLEKYSELSRFTVQPGDVLITIMGTCGRSAVVPEGVPTSITSKHLCAITLDTNRCLANYLHTCLKQPDVQRQLVQREKGAIMPGLNMQMIKELRIPLPILPEQQRIADILDKAEALRAKRRAALAQLDELTRSVFFEMFGDPLQNTSSWQQSKIDEICNLVRGSSPRPQGDPRYFGGPIPRLMIADITRDGWLVTPRIDSLTHEGARRRRPVEAGTIVMAVSGNVGLAAQLAIDACIHDGFVAFTKLVSGVDPTYLLSTLRLSRSAHDKSKAGAIFINITTNDIKNLSISIPPVALQQEFARRVQAIDRLKANHRQSLAEMDALFLSLQHRAFGGEL